jgi:hypothetical protein
MNRTLKILVMVLQILLFTGELAYSHSGGTDSSGCHNNRKTGDYHCHNSRSEKNFGNSPSILSPSDCPVIGNTDSYIYHVPGGRFYEMMLERNAGHDNRKCFDSEYEAESAGYRRSKR